MQSSSNTMKFWLIAVLSVGLGSLIWASPTTTTYQPECASSAYWCKNLTTAKNCNAVKHCIQAVWEKQNVPEDKDSVCQICLDMVKQARDQLESNETQDDLRAVFEGSCKLMYVKPIVKECIVMVDNFIPELIEALASQMNPQVVCSVAGLCNNAHIDNLLNEYTKSTNEDHNKFTCGKCSSISSQITTKFHGTSRDAVLENMLEMCGKEMGSFSDACSSIVLTYFNEIYEHLNTFMTPDSLCHLSGVCSGKFHQHEEKEESIEIRPMSNVGFVDVQDPDIPCELCEQLVNHLRVLLTANTTEAEFKTVLEGLCNQTKGFKDECTSLVDQYYAEIYETLTKNLDSNAACFYIGVCPKGLTSAPKSPIAPLVPIDVKEPKSHQKKKLLGAHEPTFTPEEIASFQLPVTRLMAKPIIDPIMGAPNGKNLVKGGQWCTICEYAMHFVQEELADPTNEENVKHAVMNTCGRMSHYLRAECDNFVELYGDAIIAVIVQEVDPANVCPYVKLCPTETEQDSEIFVPQSLDVEVHSESISKGSCPLCLLAVKQAQTIIEQDKTVDKVKDTLKNLCSHIKDKKMNLECKDFVDTYSKELIDLLMRDFTPQEICVYLKLCTDDSPKKIHPILIVAKNERDEEIETNEIADNTIEGIMFPANMQQQMQQEVVADTPECLLCKDVIKVVEQRVVNKTSKAEIKSALEHACDKVPAKARVACHNFVDKNGDRIAELIVQELSPKEICRDLALCFAQEAEEAFKVTVFTHSADKPQEKVKGNGQFCIICEMVVARIDRDLKKESTQEEVKAYMDKVCTLIPKSHRSQCDKFVEQYSELIIITFESIPPKEMCKEIQACTSVKKETKDEIFECAVCNGAVTAIDTLLKNKEVDEDIEKMLEKACNSVGERYMEKCEKMVETYGISMVEQLKQKLESDKICVNIGMCYSEEASSFVEMTDDEDSSESDESPEIDEPEIITKKQYLVGQHECTWGPSHWCKDEETATKCKTLDFCKQKSLGKWSA